MVGNATIAVRGEVNRGSFSLRHDIAAAPSRTGAAETTTVGLNYLHSFTPKFTTSTNLIYVYSNSTGDGTAANRLDEDMFEFSTNLRDQFTRSIAVVTAYSYAKAVYNQQARRPTGIRSW